MTNTSVSAEQLRGWVGRTLVDPAGDKIGKIEDIYMDEATGQPEWLAVATGWFGRRVSFVPIAGASPAAGQDDVVCRWDKAKIKDAPHAEPDGQLSQDEEMALYRHYGMRYTATGPAADAGRMDSPAGRDATAATDPARTAAGAAAAAGTPGDRARPMPAAADASTQGDMVRAEEELEIGKQSHETGKVRLRRWVETEHVTRTVPVSHEEVHLQREPIGADEAAGAEIDDLTDSEREVVLNEEQIVVNKKVVPKERVRLEKETVTEDVPVEADLRRERVEVEGLGDKPGSGS